MIKYVELTAPQANAYRQAKILSIECSEGDVVNAGDTLFIVKSGKTKLELPSTETGKIIEFIVSEKQNITLSTPLLLLETEVDRSTATPPIGMDDDLDREPEAESIPKQPSKNTNKAAKQIKQEQQSLDLLTGLGGDTQSNVKETAADKRSSKNTNKTQQETPIVKPSEPVSTHAGKVESNENRSMSDSNSITINVPDIGADSAKVIEILVQVGDEVAAEDALVTLESDKASMDVPSPKAGKVTSISVAIDQDVSEGTALVELAVVELAVSESVAESKPANNDSNMAAALEQKAQETAPEKAISNGTQSEVEVRIPDIGGDTAKVVEVLVSVGDTIDVNDALVTLESDKASMEVPSSHAGEVQSISIKLDDDVSEGSLVVTLLASAQDNADTASPESEFRPETAPAPQTPTQEHTPAQPVQQQNISDSPASGPSHASPSIRRFARELGVDLSKVQGSGRKKRVTKGDVKTFVKGVINQPMASQPAASGGGQGIPQVPAQDFSKFGEIEIQPLNKIKRLTATNLHRSWLNVPHVTHNDEANINDLEAFRKQLNAEYAKQKKDIKLSPLAFIVKAVVSALQTYPQFNSSLEPGGESLVLKKYFHVGIAVDTPNGLVVPVIRDADTKSVAQIAQEMGVLAQKARDKKLTMNDMSGACFTISSLGGIGGTSFTPIVNAPEVAILGVSRSKIQPVWNGSEFTPGMMLPLSLSYDHRVIDGAEAARFARHIALILEDIRRLTV